MEQNTELEDIIEDVTVEQLAAGLELEQESSIVSEEQVVETEEVTLEEAKEESEEEEKSEEEEEEETIEEGKNPEVVDDGEGDFKIVGASGKVARYFKRSEYGGMAKQIAQASLKKNLDKYMKEEDVKEESYAADLAALTESEANLTESFKEKAAIIFEAALTSKIREEKEKLAEQFETQLSEQTAQLREDLEDKVDNYLTYVVESWVEDNKVAVESGLRAEIAENFIGALKTVFVENYIEVPESKKDMVSELEAELAAIKESATQSQSDAVILSERVEELVREKVLAESALTLADTQAAKLANLVQDVEFVSEDTFRNKVETIKEAYFSSKDNVKALEESSDSTYETVETIVEGEDFQNEISPSMAKYLTAVSRLAVAKG
jgi:hypothetical protein